VLLQRLLEATSTGCMPQGARWNVSRNFGVQLEWERYIDVGEASTTGKSDIDMVTIGQRYKF